MALSDTFKTAQDQAIDNMKLAQDSVVKVIKGYTESVKAVVPNAPEVPFGFSFLRLSRCG